MAITYRYRLLIERDDAGAWVVVEDAVGRSRHGPWASEELAEVEGRWPMVCRWRERARRLGGHVLRPRATLVFVVLPESVQPRRPGSVEAEGACSVASPTAARPGPLSRRSASAAGG